MELYIKTFLLITAYVVGFGAVLGISSLIFNYAITNYKKPKINVIHKNDGMHITASLKIV